MASATTGDGCFRVTNVAADDVLNVRAAPAAGAAVVATLLPDNDPGIIAATGAWVPSDRPEGQRWCPETICSGDTTVKGGAKRHDLAPSECP